MVISLFGKITDKTKLVFQYDDVVIGSRTEKEYAFQMGNFLNMLYENIECESKTMTNKVVLHNLLVEINHIKRQNRLYDELVSIVNSFQTNDKQKAYNDIKKCFYIISVLYKDYYKIPVIAYDIDWETDGYEIELPTQVRIPNNVEEDYIADYLSDEYGYLVNGFKILKTIY